MRRSAASRRSHPGRSRRKNGGKSRWRALSKGIRPKRPASSSPRSPTKRSKKSHKKTPASRQVFFRLSKSSGIASQSFSAKEEKESRMIFSRALPGEKYRQGEQGEPSRRPKRLLPLRSARVKIVKKVLADFFDRQKPRTPVGARGGKRGAISRGARSGWKKRSRCKSWRSG